MPKKMDRIVKSEPPQPKREVPKFLMGEKKVKVEAPMKPIKEELKRSEEEAIMRNKYAEKPKISAKDIEVQEL
jgi:hypothetical protein